ncbi:MAG TPA: Smr/MutS family protein, partial [Methylomirabilota bacterium]|nr:Smr/MutS family protein [Methylomirabilota bacterium]
AREAEAGAKHRAGSILARAKAEAEALLTEIRRAVNAEWEKLKSTERSRKSLEGSRKRLRESASRIEPSAPEPARDDPAQLHTGATVAAEHLGVRGELIAIEGSTATVRSGSVTVRIPAQALRVVTGSAPSVRQTSVRLPEKTAVGTELHLIGQTTDEARDRLEKYLDDVFLAGLASVRIIHGKGSGALRKAVRDLLSSHPLVDSFRDGELREGGAGATVVTLKLT